MTIDEQTARKLCEMRGFNPDDVVKPDDTRLPPELSFPRPRWQMFLPEARTALMATKSLHQP